MFINTEVETDCVNSRINNLCLLVFQINIFSLMHKKVYTVHTQKKIVYLFALIYEADGLIFTRFSLTMI